MHTPIASLPERFTLTPKTLVCPRLSAPSLESGPEAPEWSAARFFGGFVRGDGCPATEETSLWLGHDDGYFYAAVRCNLSNTDALRRYTGSNNYRQPEKVMLYLDTTHDHVGLRRFDFGPYGQIEAWEASFTVAYRDGPDARWLHPKYESALRNYCRFATHVEEGRHWWVTLAIPFESLGAPPPSRGAVWGINVHRQSLPPACPESGEQDTYLAAWPNHPAGHPVCFADLVFDDAAPQLRELHLDAPHFGENRNRARFVVPNATTPLVLTSRVRSRRGGESIDPLRESPLQAVEAGVFEGDLVWQAVHFDDTNVLDIEVKRAADDVVEWRGGYDFGWEAGSLPLHYLHLGETADPPPDPDPDDPAFLRKKAEFICGRQPRFRRVNTAQGAPSDFTLQSADDRIQFNLMEAGVTDRMARYLHSLYATDADRLLGMMFFMAQPCMMRAHTAYDPDAAHRLNPLSKLRFGSGYCGHMVRVLTPLVNRMPCKGSGNYHQAHSAMIGGHVMTMVNYRDDYVLLDPKHCCMLYRLDNSDLATLAEIRREPEIVRRAYPHWIMRALMTFNESHVAGQAPDTFDADGYSYPPNAPVG